MRVFIYSLLALAMMIVSSHMHYLAGHREARKIATVTIDRIMDKITSEYYLVRK